MQLAATTAAPAEARAAIRDAIDGDPRIEAALLATSEMITNALVHGELDAHDLIELRIARLGPILLIEVLNDPAPGFALADIAERDPASDRPGGWGLRIVGALSSDWGAAVEHGRTLVWFEVA